MGLHGKWSVVTTDGPDDPRWDALRHLAHRRVIAKLGDAADPKIEDLVSECLRRVWHCMRREVVANPEGLVTDIAHKIAYSHIKRRARERRIFEAIDDDVLSVPEPERRASEFCEAFELSMFMVRETVRRIDAAELPLLDARRRGASHEETATELGIQPAAARKRWSRLQRRLRAELAGDPDFPLPLILGDL